MSELPKVITIDGPSGVGKGTASRAVANALGWDWLDSGALYRLTAYAAKQAGVSETDELALADVARALKVAFSKDENQIDPDIFLDGVVINPKIRTVDCGKDASKISAFPAVRQALFERQRAFLTEKGLVADGRDMGTVIFPESPVKIFLTASANVRAERRFKQLKQAGVDVSIARLLQEIEARDQRDQTRKISPLVPAEDALVIDTSNSSKTQVYQHIMSAVAAKYGDK